MSRAGVKPVQKTISHKSRQRYPAYRRSNALVLDFVGERITAYLNRIQWELESHVHPHFELLYIIKGVREGDVDGRHFKACAGDLLIFRPSDHHREYAGTRTASFFVFRFRPDELAEAHLEFPKLDAVGPVISLPCQKEFYDLFSRMMDEKNHSGEGSQLLLGAYLVEFVVKLRRVVNQVLSRKTGGAQDSIQIRIRAAMDLMQENISHDMNLKKIARNVFMSTSHFSHVFKEKTGETPKHYLIRARVKRAKELLANTGLTSREIAERLEYTTPYYFYRQFRQKTGLTAGQYRLRFKQPARKCI